MKFQKKHKPVTKKIWNLLRYAPTFIRKKVIRSQFELSYDLPPEYTFKQAETEKEIEEALNIVYESYTWLGYIDHREEKIHFNAFLCMPTTTILIIKYKDEVIGTMSIVPDSAFGLPSEKTWDLSSIRSKEKRLAEISSLSIKKTHKNSKGNILFTLCKLMYSYCVDILKLDGIVIATTIEVEAFYTDLLMFKKVTSDTEKEHSLVKGNKSTCCYLNLNTAEKVFYKEYHLKNNLKNIYYFFVHYISPNISMPQKQISLQALHLQKNQSMVKILEKFPDLKKMFTNEDKLTLANLDPLSHIDKAINFDDIHTTRVYPRISIRDINAFVYYNKTTFMQPSQIVDVSRFGFGLKVQYPIANVQLQESFILIFNFNNEGVSIHAYLQWFKDDGYGFIVSEKSQEDWEKFIRVVFAEINLSVHFAREITKKRAA